MNIPVFHFLPPRPPPSFPLISTGKLRKGKGCTSGVTGVSRGEGKVLGTSEILCRGASLRILKENKDGQNSNISPRGGIDSFFFFAVLAWDLVKAEWGEKEVAGWAN